MEKLPFSEFSYGFSFVENMMRSDSIVPGLYPVFPSLREEAKLGYDVKFDHPGAILYFQFKIPKKLKTDRALETNRNRFNIGDLYPPFLRMPIINQTNSSQHNTLIRREKRKKKENRNCICKKCSFVFYATPMFSSSSELNNYFQTHSVHRKSALFSPLEIGTLRPGDYHSVAYNLEIHNPRHGWVCSNTPARWKFRSGKSMFSSKVKPVKIYRYSRIMQAVNYCLRRSERSRIKLIDAIYMELESIKGYVDDDSPITHSDASPDRSWYESETYNRFKEMGMLEYASSEFRRPSDDAEPPDFSDMGQEMKKLTELREIARSHLGVELVIFQRH